MFVCLGGRLSGFSSFFSFAKLLVEMFGSGGEGTVFSLFITAASFSLL